MASSDAVIVGEDWISEHFFTTDAKNDSFLKHVLNRRKDWDAAPDGEPTVRSRFIGARVALETALADLIEDSSDDAMRAVHDQVRSVLGFVGMGYVVERSGPLCSVSVPGLADVASLVLIDAIAVDAIEDLLAKDAKTLLAPFEVDAKNSISSVARLLSTLFVEERGPEFALVNSGRWLLVAERARWAEGRYLAIDFQLVCERNDAKRGGEVDTALTCVSAESLAPSAKGDIWWQQVLKDSVKHTVGVSKDLREGVRLSIEIIANEVVRRRKDQGFESLSPEQAQPLAKQSLRFLYRVLFLLYAEASPELGVLPVGAPEYVQGYSLDRLRELALVEMTSPRSMDGTHLYESLAVLFRLVDLGNQIVAPVPGQNSDVEAGEPEGLEFQSLRADLFLPAAINLIDQVGLGNAALQGVLRHLLLSKESKGRDRGFISYVELGINQLGAVYEGLMSYSGFFAETDLYEVSKDGDSEKGSWVVPIERAGGIAEKDFVRVTDTVTGESKAVLHEQGTFVFRLAGRERQQSASYYTPEVLTRFTVSQALKELLDQDGHKTSAGEILKLTVCEPALGSGAFAIEAVRQLAEEYLRRRQDELGAHIDPETYPRRLQEVKASIALHQVYGVDLNATAVELAEISLWLDTMVAGLRAPWFGLRLRRGNSLVGARRATYSESQVNTKSWLKATPRDIPLTDLAQNLADDIASRGTSGRIHHFLLPADGWGSAVGVPKDVAALAPDAVATVKAWRKKVTNKPSKTQVKRLIALSDRVETLWQFALRRRQIAELEARRSIPLWGREDEPSVPVVTREEIETAFDDLDGAFRRLRLVMDAWCALWFWPLTSNAEVQPPTLEQWIDTCVQILGSDTQSKAGRAKGMATFAAGGAWEELGEQEKLDLAFAGAKPVGVVLDENPWLQRCVEIADRQGFFHWELDFATVFSQGGFDLQVGNPPWVRPRSDVEALLAEGDPWWQLALKPSEAEKATHRSTTLAIPGVRELVLEGTGEVAVIAAFVGSPVQYPYLAGQPDLYRGFMSQAWAHASHSGMAGLIHLETHFTDEKAGALRAQTYARLRRHWQFINELKLFEIQDQKAYGVNVYGAPQDPRFWQASALYHPDTVERSFRHDGSGEEPGYKDPSGTWDVRPHVRRLQLVTDETLLAWREVLESAEIPARQTRALSSVNTSAANVLLNLGLTERIGSLGLKFSHGWDESIDRQKGYFEKRWGRVSNWDQVILQGPHLFVSTPFYKSPNASMLHQQDWSEIDLESLDTDALPVTAYKPTAGLAAYDASYTHWGESGEFASRDYYRVAWRRMAANTGERTLIPALIPPGAAHVHPINSAGLPGQTRQDLVRITATLSSLLSDFLIRAVPKGDIHGSTINRLPIVSPDHPLITELFLRTLRLNCVTGAYADLWRDCWTETYADDDWTGGATRGNRSVLGDVKPQWDADTPLRVAADRRRAQVEIDALVALMLGVTADELCTVYRTQFAVLYGYDHHDYTYDANGRVVPNPVLREYRRKGERVIREERTHVNKSGHEYLYELPFSILDREVDMREAYAEFERRLAERRAER